MRILSLLLLIAVSPSSRSTGQAPDPQPSRFTTSTAGIVVDVVVRDKQGRPVQGLTRDDFEVFEDDVAQRVIAFEPYSGDVGALETTAASTGLGVNPPGKRAPVRSLAAGPPIIALAWDRLGPEGRAMAHDAAKRLVATKQPGELVGVFVTDMTLKTVQPYTTDAEKLARAVENLANTATSQMAREASGLDSFIGRAETPQTASAEDSGMPLVGIAQPGAGGRREGDPRAGGELGMLQMLVRMERTYKQFLYETQGRASLIGLLALVDSLGQLPGRKTLLFFCEGLTITSAQESRYRSIIDTANRNNVSVYTFDSAGLRVHSSQAQTAREIGELTPFALGTAGGSSEKMIENLETNERLLKMDPAVSLGILARETGGRLINNTNALDRAIDLVNEDRRHHYLLSYVSSNGALDGSFRQIKVKVRRPGLDVRARSGYRAVPASTTGPVLDYEAPALAALTRTPAPLSFPIAARALSVPMPGRPGLTAVVVGVNGSVLTTGRDKDGKMYAASATILARFVGPDGKEVTRRSQKYQFTGEMAKREESLNRMIIFFRTPELPAGRQTLEAAVYDEMGERSTVLRIPIDVPAAAPVLIGDLFVVSHTERVEAGQPQFADHPLVWQGALLYPSFGEPIRKSVARELTFALPMVAAGGASAVLELRQGSKALASLPLPAEAPGSDGRLTIVGRLPLEHVPPGAYELALKVTAGQATATRSAGFTILD